MSGEQAAEIQRRLDNLSIEEFERDYRSADEAATEYFQDLFVEVLNFEEMPSNLGDALWQDLPVHEWRSSARATDARMFAEAGNFRVVYIELEKLSRTAERNSIQSLTRSDQTSGWAIDGSFLAVFHAPGEKVWHLVTPYEEGTDDITTGRPVLRRYTLGEGETHHTVSNALAELDADKPGRLAARVDEAFQVKPVTKDFYENYKSVFDTLTDEFDNKGLEIEEADRYAHIILNRLMFFYYLQKKEWIGGRKDFIRWFHEQYQESDDEGVFHEKWLSSLFFEGMNRPEGELVDADLPDEVESVITDMPYMNGGLFQPTKEDERDAYLSDAALNSVINGFLEEYNFTVTEESPYDIDVAVDPAMLGKIYESLIAEQERGEAGIFYTPRVEVDLMSRLALYEQFIERAEKPGEEGKRRIVEYIFSESRDWDPENVGESKELENILHSLRVVDPACGSGAYLVGMKQVLSELYRKLGIQPDYSLKEQIINENLYGVDIKDWAVRVAEFRLWLSLVENEETLPEQRPILPNFSFKLRVGDSILQALEGEEVSFEDIQRKATGEVYKQIEALENLKDRFFDGETDLRDEIKEKQKSVLIAHIESRINSLQAETQTQKTLGGSETESSKKKSKSAKRRIEDLDSLKEDLVGANSTTFLWERDFLEVMLDGGFDVVIGNPPYVRQEDIINQGINPKLVDNMSSKEVKDLKKQYKSKLQSYVQSTYGIKPYLRSDLYLPFFFKGMEVLKEGGTLVFVTSSSWLDVDYGVRLQEGLLRNAHINRILDNRTQRTFVEADVNTIITSLNKSSGGLLKGATDFSAIYQPYNEVVDDETMKHLLANIRNDTETIDFDDYQLHLQGTDSFRKITVKEKSLWKQGGGSVSDANGTQIHKGGDRSGAALPQGSYSTGKWGKYLRAPNVYFQIIGDSSNHFDQLTDISSIQRGIRSGANQFFYLPNKHFDVEIQGKKLLLISSDSGEVEFQIPKKYWMQKRDGEWIPNYLLKNSRGFQNPLVEQKNLEIGSSLRYLVIIDDPKQELDNATLEYVKWGEGHDTESCSYCRKSSPIPDSCSSSGEGWFDISPMLRRGDILPMQNIDKRHAYWVPKKRTFIDQRLHGIEVPNSKDRLAIAGLLNSTLGYLQLEINGRANLGQGALDVTTDDHGLSLIPSFERISEETLNEIKKNFEKIGSREVATVFEELGADNPSDFELDNVKSDRRELDKIVFEKILNLPVDQQEAIYTGFLELVKNRLDKASSVE